jgi:hypothetical protein
MTSTAERHASLNSRSPSADRPETRLATRLAFLVAGFAVACWAALVPYAKQRLQIDDGVLGLLMLGLGVGSIATMLATGALNARYGSRPIIIAGGFGLVVLLPVLAVAGSPLSLGVALLAFGAALGSLDVAMNIHAVEVERTAASPLMSGFHALFSVGGFLGAGTSLLSAQIAPLASTLIAAVLMAAAMAFAAPRLLRASSAEGGPSNRRASRDCPHPCGNGLRHVPCRGRYSRLERLARHWRGDCQRGAGRPRLFVVCSRHDNRTTGWRFRHGTGRRPCHTVLERPRNDCGFRPSAGSASRSCRDGRLSGDRTGGVKHCAGAVPRWGAQRAMPAGLAVAAITTAGYAGVLVGPAAIGFTARALGLPGAFWLLGVLVGLVVLGARKATSAHD